MRVSGIEVLSALQAGGGVLRRRDHPELGEQIDWLVRRQALQAVLPGVYAATELAQEFEIRVRAVMGWDADAVLVGRAAAKVSFWPRLGVDDIEVALPRKRRSPRGFAMSQRRVPAELVEERGGIRFASPALTALDLCATEGGNAIDTVLRTRAATLDQLHDALAATPTRRGNTDRRTLLLDSRDKPWSEAERALHHILREAGIDGWDGNWGFQQLTGTYWIDVAFPELRLAIEVDGWEFHNSREAFEEDRWRQNDLVLAGWRVLRFTARMIQDHPAVVLRTIQAALAG